MQKYDLLGSNLDIGIRKNFLKIFVRNLVFYGSKTWGTSDKRLKIVGHFEM